MFPSLDAIASSAYVENPSGYHFEGQDVDEKILLLLRAHLITNLSWIIPAVLLFLLPFFVPKLLFLAGIDLSFLPYSFRITFLLLNYLFILVIAFEGFLSWYFNVYIVTDKNLIDVDFHSLLFKNIDIAPLRNVEDVSSSMAGVSHAVFHYGNVFIQTAGATKSIDFHNIPNPHHVADFILDMSHKIYRR